MSEVHAASNYLGQQIHVMAQDMVERLRSAEAMKLALLEQQQAEISRDLDAIQVLVTNVQASNQSGLVEFLNSSKDWENQCQRLAAKVRWTAGAYC